MKKLSIIFIGIAVFITLTSSIRYSTIITDINNPQKSITLGVFEDVSAIEFKKLIETNEYILVDVRTVNEYKQAHIKGSVNIDWYNRTFEVEIQKLDKTKPILIYCRSGNRTSKTKFAMLGMGFQKVYNLKHGVNDWAKNNFTFVK